MQINAVSTAKRLDWQGWFLGLWTSTISGGAGAVAGALGPMVIDHKDFNMGSGFAHLMGSMLISFGFTAFFSLCKFLQLHPAPDALSAALDAAAVSTQKTAEAVAQAQANVPEVK